MKKKSSIGVVVLFLNILITFNLGAEIGKYFTKSPQSIVVPPGDHVTFECETNIPAEQVRWKLNAGFLYPGNDSDVRISGNFLYVKVSKNRDRYLKQVGDYQCVVEFGGEGLTSVPAQLTIAHIDPYPGGKNSSVVVVDGSTVGINCEYPYSNPIPIITFFKNGRVIEPENTNNLILMDSGILHIRNVSPGDSGYYSCSSTNHITSETYSANYGTILTVNHRSSTPRKSPEFLIQPKSNTIVPQDGNVTLECIAIGNPPPFITWRKLRSGSMRKAELDHENLILFNADFGHEGEYICEAYNEIGTITAASTIVINSMPNITKEPMSLVVEEGSEINLNCSSDGLPSPRVYWIFNGHNLLPDHNLRITDSGLRISAVEKKHAGLFQCFATNPMGTVSSPAEVKVIPKQITAASLPNDSTGNGFYSPPPITRHHKIQPKFHGGGKHKRRKLKGQDMIPPSKPHMNRVSDNSVMVRWSVPANSGYPIQFFKIQYKEVSKKNSRWLTLDEDIPPHIHSFEVNDLRLGQTYKFRIMAVYSNNDNREGPNSDKFILQRDIGMRRPSFVPMVTTVAPHNTSSIILKWRDSRIDSNGVEGYFIYYRESTSAGDYSKATVLGSNSDSYYITHLKPGTAYDIKIQAFNRAGASNFSSINTAKTLGFASTEKPDDELRKKEIDFNIPDDPPPSQDRFYVLLGCLFAGFWIFLCITCALCYKCKKRRAEEEAKYACDIDVIGNGHILNGYIPTIASHLQIDQKETSFVERMNNNRPISGSGNLGTLSYENDLEMSSWTEIQPIRSLPRKKQHLNTSPLDDHLEKDPKIFPKEHYKSRRNSLGKSRNSINNEI